MKWIPSRFSFMLLLIFLSCKSVGPKVIPQDQFNFNSSISTASNEQLLVNLIRLRYLESPVFLKVSSVINQYTRSGGVNAQAGLNNAIPTGSCSFNRRGLGPGAVAFILSNRTSRQEVYQGRFLIFAFRIRPEAGPCR